VTGPTATPRSHAAYLARPLPSAPITPRRARERPGRPYGTARVAQSRPALLVPAARCHGVHCIHYIHYYTLAPPRQPSPPQLPWDSLFTPFIRARQTRRCAGVPDTTAWPSRGFCFGLLSAACGLRVVEGRAKGRAECKAKRMAWSMAGLHQVHVRFVETVLPVVRRHPASLASPIDAPTSARALRPGVRRVREELSIEGVTG